MKTIIIACPQAHIDDANQLARCVGLGPDDDRTFNLPLWQDDDGNRYAVASGLVSETFEQAVVNSLVEPTWGCDIDAAQRAQVLIRLPDTETGEMLATPNTISAAFGADAMSIIAALGLTAVIQEYGI
jgi:hypothetical protein